MKRYMSLVHYVKFMRGTQTMYNELVTKDSDTLYFVYENAQADKGKLYLGNKLISGSSSIDGNISLADLADVAAEAGIATDGDILVYNSESGEWEPMPLTTAIGMDVMEGATASTAGVAGLVPVPPAGAQNKFLRGDGTWVEVTGTLSPEDLASISTLQTQVITLIGDDTGKSVADIVTTLLIPEDAQESLDTLQEIADWIQNHPDDAATMSSDITVLQGEVANLTELLNGTVSHPENGLSARVTALETTMGAFVPVQNKYLNVGSAITYLDNSITSINSSITSLDDRLRWHELSNE